MAANKETNIKINGKDILTKLGYDDREKTSLYISKKLMKRFKASLGDESASRAIELLIQAFLDTVESK